MNIQSETVRQYVLDLLESGVFSGGMRLPGSRKLSEQLGISRPVVQSALDTMVNEGVLRSVSRSGLYVDEEWKSRRIRGCIKFYTNGTYLPWLERFRKDMKSILPELHVSTVCDEGVFEIVTTAIAQTRHREFVDLMPLLKKCYPDLSSFCTEQFYPFMQEERLTALPLVFSPRVIACNRRLLAAAGCGEPALDWSMDDFMTLVQKLKKIYPPEMIFPWTSSYYLWMNFLLCCGGKLFCLDREDPVCFDTPESIAALEYFRQLKCSLNMERNQLLLQCDKFVFSVVDWQLYGLNKEAFADQFLFLPMPGTRPEYSGRSIQATELLVMRKGSLDKEFGIPIIRYLLSAPFQDHLAELDHGIPVRISSMQKVFAEPDQAGRVFCLVRERLCNEYHLSSPDLFRLVSSGIASVLAGSGNIRQEVCELADVVRKYLKYTSFK